MSTLTTSVSPRRGVTRPCGRGGRRRPASRTGMQAAGHPSSHMTQNPFPRRGPQQHAVGHRDLAQIRSGDAHLAHPPAAHSASALPSCMRGSPPGAVGKSRALRPGLGPTPPSPSPLLEQGREWRTQPPLPLSPCRYKRKWRGVVRRRRRVRPGACPELRRDCARLQAGAARSRVGDSSERGIASRSPAPPPPLTCRQGCGLASAPPLICGSVGHDTAIWMAVRPFQQSGLTPPAPPLPGGGGLCGGGASRGASHSPPGLRPCVPPQSIRRARLVQGTAGRVR